MTATLGVEPSLILMFLSRHHRRRASGMPRAIIVCCYGIANLSCKYPWQNMEVNEINKGEILIIDSWQQPWRWNKPNLSFFLMDAWHAWQISLKNLGWVLNFLRDFFSPLNWKEWKEQLWKLALGLKWNCLTMFVLLQFQYIVTIVILSFKFSVLSYILKYMLSQHEQTGRNRYCKILDTLLPATPISHLNFYHNAQMHYAFDNFILRVFFMWLTYDDWYVSWFSQFRHSFQIWPLPSNMDFCGQ